LEDITQKKKKMKIAKKKRRDLFHRAVIWCNVEGEKEKRKVFKPMLNRATMVNNRATLILKYRAIIGQSCHNNIKTNV
jgi:hypothetical protein